MPETSGEGQEHEASHVPATVGQRLATARRSRALSQAEVGVALGRPQSIVSRWEAGERAMTAHEFVELSRLLALDPDRVLATDRVLRDHRRRSSRARPRTERRAVGVAIAAARKQAGLDPVVTARQAGLTAYRLWRIEGGHDATLFELARIAEALGVAPSSLVPRQHLTGGHLWQISTGAAMWRRLGRPKGPKSRSSPTYLPDGLFPLGYPTG